jgi:uncharacterized protein (DUF1697 family)
VALLRGINVSGQKKIKMNELKTHLQNMGFENVQTYIQSGNIIFRFIKMKIPELENLISEKIKLVWGFEVPVLIRTPDELLSIIQDNPFRDPGETERVYITLLSVEPQKNYIETIQNLNYIPERFKINKRTIYFHSPLNYGNAKMNTNFFENKLKVSATTRNWKTINKLFSLSHGQG